MHEQPSDASKIVNTGDSPYLQGAVHTSEGDVVGCDKVTIGPIIKYRVSDDR